VGGPSPGGSKGVLIDASVLIDHERGRVNLEERVKGREEEASFLSVVTASELLHAVHRARDPAVRARRSAFVEGVLGSLPLLPIEIATARMHAQIWADLAAQGHPIGAHGLWIAASCLSRGLTLVTSNLREFERVPGLVMEDWSAGPGGGPDGPPAPLNSPESSRRPGSSGRSQIR
jgi:tRNA(fMet)-specific endonuclease VapC